MNDVTKTRKDLGYFIKQIEQLSCLVYCDRNMNDAISTRKIPEYTRLRLMFSLGIFLVEITSFMFLSQHRDTQAIFYLLNRDTKVIFYLFYKITKVFSSFRDVIRVSTVRENEVRPIRDCVGRVLFYKA